LITLDEAYDIALATDQDIGVAYWEVRKANLLPWSALARRIGPNFSVGPSYASTQTRGEGSANGDAESGSIAFSYTQTFVDFSVFPAYRNGKLAAVAARLKHQYTVRQTLFGVTSAYYAVLAAEGVVKTDKTAVDLAAQQADVAQKRLNVGEVTRTDALNAEVTLESARRTLIQDQNTLLLDRDTLGNLLNLGGDTGFRVTMPEDYPTAIPPFEKLLAIGYRSREDLKTGEIAVAEDIAQKGVDLAAYLPTMGGNVENSLANSSGFYGPQSQVWDASISVSIPVLTGGQREISVRTDSDQIQEDKLNRDKIAKTVEGDVKAAWLNARSLQDSLPALRAQVKASGQSYEDLQHQYEAGTVASLDVLSALSTFITSENTLAVQINALQVALRKLEVAAGVFQEQRVEQAKIK
jgi:outer membrane protein TolC